MLDRIICSNRPDLEMHVSVISAPKELPRFNVYAIDPTTQKIVFCLELSLEQGQLILEGLEGSFEMMENLLYEASEKNKH
jgi:hypothetical protein